jgi:hypothetical protein
MHNANSFTITSVDLDSVLSVKTEHQYQQQEEHAAYDKKLLSVLSEITKCGSATDLNGKFYFQLLLLRNIIENINLLHFHLMIVN